MTTRLNATGLVGGYGDGEDIVRGVDLTVAGGELTVIVGPNGAGKSTLLKILAGLVPARRGGVELDAVALPAGDPVRIATAGVGFVPQERNVFGSMTVRENLEIGAYLAPRQVKRRVAAQLERFPVLAAKARAPARSLSGGQRQVLALAIALMMSPKVLLLDEPSVGLSPIAAEDLFVTIKSLAAQGMAVLMVEQNALAALETADHGIVMMLGQVSRSSPARALAADPEIRRLFL
ncbi:MAG: ABC transporter ATP-binding protein, partial [Betaproteobacteria bacterium]|nr:ABC transporter ATP-binding protein [Betaproteobacteria bacterium]